MSIREAISMIYPGAQKNIGELVVDAVIKESHQFSAQITEHPVEDGSSIADHVYNLPVTLDLHRLQHAHDVKGAICQKSGQGQSACTS